MVFTESTEPLHLSVLAAFAGAKPFHTLAGNAPRTGPLPCPQPGAGSGGTGRGYSTMPDGRI